MEMIKESSFVILEANYSFVIITSLMGKVIYISEKLKKMIKDKIVGINIEDLFFIDPTNEHQALFLLKNKKFEVDTFESEDKKIYCFKEILREDKKKQAILNMLSRYKMFFEKLPFPAVVFELSPEGFPSQILEANEKFIKESGYESDEIKSVNAISLFDIGKIEDTKKMIKELIGKKGFAGKITLEFEKKEEKNEYEIDAVMENYNEHNVVIMILRKEGIK